MGGIISKIKYGLNNVYATSIRPLVFKMKFISIKKQYNKSIYPTVKLIDVIEYNKYRDKGPQNLLCNAPFTSLFITMNGDVNVCGYNQSYILGNVLQTPLSKIWLNEKHLTLQDAISNYNLSMGCTICQQKIDMKDYHRASIYYDSPQPSTIIRLKKITFELSNTCNLECVMCNGELSSIINKNREHNENLKQNSFTLLVDDLDYFLDDLTFTQFLGGEPLLIKSYYAIWNKIIAKNKKCKISIQTNATLLPVRFKELLENSQDRQFIISISIDSFEKVQYEKIRVNANYDEVLNNINYLITLRDKNKIELSLNFVPMTINWEAIPVAVAFANKHQLILSMCELDSPYEYSFYSMSVVEIERIIDFLQRNCPQKPTNIIENHNYNLFNNQVIQLKNIQNILIDADNLYTYKKIEDISILQNELEDNFLQLPVVNSKIKVLIEDYRTIIFDEVTQNRLLERLIKLNRYFYIRKIFFTQKVDTAYTTKRFENLLYYELRSAFKTIIN